MSPERRERFGPARLKHGGITFFSLTGIASGGGKVPHGDWIFFLARLGGGR
jgi:hypothetical protein